MNRSLYLAGGLFNLGERMRNSMLEESLHAVAAQRGLKLEITSPQRDALKRFISTENRFDIDGIVADCVKAASTKDVVLCNIDGADADSGTAVEYGIALGCKLFQENAGQKGPQIIAYRTDFRTAIEKEAGVNAMLRAAGTTLIYLPCFSVEVCEFKPYCNELAVKIVDVIK